MRQIILMFLATILITGCKANGAPEGAGEGRFNAETEFDSSRALLTGCNDTGGTHVNLFYDNHQIRTVAVAHLAAGEIFAIRLKPTKDSQYDRPGVDYETVAVTISGKNAASAWLSAFGSHTSTGPPNHELVICVPPNQAKGTYYYAIHISNTGSLDPRGDVE